MSEASKPTISLDVIHWRGRWLWGFKTWRCQESTFHDLLLGHVAFRITREPRGL